MNLRQTVAASIRAMRSEALTQSEDAEEIVNRAGGYACALYIDLKNAGHRIQFSVDTLARCGGVPSDPQFFCDAGALDEFLSQLGDVLPAAL